MEVIRAGIDSRLMESNLSSATVAVPIHLLNRLPRPLVFLFLHLLQLMLSQVKFGQVPQTYLCHIYIPGLL